MSDNIESAAQDVGISPKQAKKRLEFMGYDQETWNRIMDKGLGGKLIGSHEVRALITIARGTEPRLLGEVYREVRQAEGLPPDLRQNSS